MQTPLNNLIVNNEIKLIEMAQASGLDVGTISRIKNGKPASRNQAEKLARAYPGEITEIELIYPERFVDELEHGGERIPKTEGIAGNEGVSLQ